MSIRIVKFLCIFFIVMLLFSSPILKFLYGLHGQILNDAKLCT
jgi:hypothetical protein